MMQQNLKTLSAQQAVRAIIRLLPRISDENLIRLTHLGERLSNAPEVLDGAENVREMLETPGHPTKVLFRHVLEYLPTERRIRLFSLTGPGSREVNWGITGRWNSVFGLPSS